MGARRWGGEKERSSQGRSIEVRFFLGGFVTLNMEDLNVECVMTRA